MTQTPAPAFNAAAFQAAFAAPLADWRGKRVCVALSGGLDSVVLLHLLCAVRESLGLAALSAVHVHHGLQAAADGWADFCADLCRREGVAFHCERVSVQRQGQGVEAAARQARYAALARTGADIVALAHHADDQAETFLLAALRGGGVRALAGMPAARPLDGRGRTVLWRPLLPFGRDELAAYADAEGLDWVEDPSNADVALLRNRVRRMILPPLLEQVPQALHHIQAAVALLQDEQAVLAEHTAADWAAVCAQGFFDRTAWQRFSPPRRRQLLRHFAEEHGLGLPRRAALLHWERELAGGAATGEWRLPQGRAVLYRERLFAAADGFERQFGWLDGQACSGNLNDAAQAGGLIWQKADWGLSETVLHEPGRIRAVRSDDVLALPVGRKPVKKILQEHGIPPFVRPFWPVAVDGDDRCIAVVNIRCAHPAVAGGYLPVSPLLAGFLGAN